MKTPGVPSDDLLVRSRAALLDALEAFRDHRDSVIVIGAQAVYLRTKRPATNLAEATKDSDLALDPRNLEDDPLIEVAMTRARFYRDPTSDQPRAWVSPEGIPVDLMVPEELAGPGGRSARAARLPPHERGALRRARGLEAVLVDNEVMNVVALDPSDGRALTVRVSQDIPDSLGGSSGSFLRLVVLGRVNGHSARNSPSSLMTRTSRSATRSITRVPA